MKQRAAFLFRTSVLMNGTNDTWVDRWLFRTV